MALRQEDQVEEYSVGAVRLWRRFRILDDLPEELGQPLHQRLINVRRSDRHEQVLDPLHHHQLAAILSLL